MTAGNILDDKTHSVKNNGKVGAYYSKVWSGGDRSPIGRPSPPPPVPPFHEYASGLDLNRFRRNQRIVVLNDVYSRWREARDSFFKQLKAYHLAKAEWIRKSRSEMHPYNLGLVHYLYGIGSYWNTPGNWGDTGVSLNSTFGMSGVVPTWTSNDDIALINKFKAELDGGTGFHLGVSLAEVDRTLRMIGSNAKRFRRIGESLSSGNFEKALRVAFNGSAANHIKGFSGLRGVADNYLLFQFGIKPLIHDVVDGARSYGYKVGRPKSVRVSVSRNIETTGSGPVGGAWKQPYKHSITKSIVGYICVDGIVDESGMLDLPSIIWERIPYSFVVDWWIGVGAFLSALHAARTVNGLTSFCQTSTTRVRYGPISSGSMYQITSAGGDFYKSVHQQRTVNKKLVVPPPSLRPLFHKDHEVSVRHTLEAIALIVQKGPLLRTAFARLQS